jgi:hypothetical protein
VNLNSSPSINPHAMATTGIKYVTEEAKTGLLSFINLLKAIRAKPVPTIDSIDKYPRPFIFSGFDIISGQFPNIKV